MMIRYAVFVSLAFLASGAVVTGLLPIPLPAVHQLARWLAERLLTGSGALGGVMATR